MEENKMKIDFSYTDEFGQGSRLIKTFDSCVLDDISSFELLVADFKNFLISSGYAQETVNQLKIVEDWIRED